MARKKGQKALSVDISDTDHEELSTYAAKNDLTVAQIIRRLVRILLEGNKSKSSRNPKA